MPYDPVAAVQAVPTRDAALRRLAAFVPGAGSAYARGRGVDPGPEGQGAVSGLSPWVRHRLVTEREVVAAALAAHGPSGAEAFVKEVLWRTYWKGWLEQRPEVWHRYRLAVERHARDRALMQRVEAAAAGRTGIDAFDNWMQDLAATGTLHNHARMWTASIWIFTLRLPWEMGADLFLRRLMDGDPASNTLSWRWVAGLHTPGKTYRADPDVIHRDTAGRFRPHGLATEAPAVREDRPPPPPLMPPEPPGVDPALPSVLLLTEDDLCPQDLLPPNLTVRGAAALSCAAARSPLPVSPLVRGFTQGALGDALDRLGYLGRYLPRDAAAIVCWARETGAAQVVAPYAPVGPAREVLDAAAPALAAAGIRLARPRRPWDATLWPLATKGFFPFWKAAAPRLPDLL